MNRRPDETVSPEVTRASVDAYLARTFPALFATQQAERSTPAAIRDSLDDAGRIRAAERALDLAALVIEARTAEVPAAEIARRAQCTEGYVHRVWREHRAQQ